LDEEMVEEIGFVLLDARVNVYCKQAAAIGIMMPSRPFLCISDVAYTRHFAHVTLNPSPFSLITLPPSRVTQYIQ